MLELFFLLWSRPRAALLDEIEAGLDEARRAIVVRELRALVDQGVGLVVVSHDASFADALHPTTTVVLC